MKKFILIIFIGLLSQQALHAQKTLKVWVVRHAEKLTDNPNEKDPHLSQLGVERAEALKNYRKYLDLTDESFESRLRYAQFLVYASDFETLGKEAGCKSRSSFFSVFKKHVGLSPTQFINLNAERNILLNLSK